MIKTEEKLTVINKRKYDNFLKKINKNIKLLDKNETYGLSIKGKKQIQISYDIVDYYTVDFQQIVFELDFSPNFKYENEYVIDDFNKKIYLLKNYKYTNDCINYESEYVAYLIDLEYNKVLNGLKRYAKY